MTNNPLREFRQAVYQNARARADGLLDLLDALTTSPAVRSPVALSESPLFRRQFSSVYDVLEAGAFELNTLRELLAASQPATSETLAGYEVYAVDATPNERMAAETLPERGALKAQTTAPVRYGHKYSWLVRLVQVGTSWGAPLDVTRIPTSSTDTQIAAEQVQRLARHTAHPKVMVADSRYRDRVFVRLFAELPNTHALVRLQNNQTLYEAPAVKPAGSPGRPRKHGDAFPLQALPREPDAQAEFLVGAQTVRVRAWQHLHFKRVAQVVGTVLCVEFLKPDGTPRYQRPLWLFWTGPTDVPLADLCRMYLWRFAIEHLFRFLKQHLGLNANQSPALASAEKWMWLCALAYWQLLLLRHHVPANRPAWHPKHKAGRSLPLTPAQVQRAALPFLLQAGTPARRPRPAGKGRGRPSGYQPPPRTRFEVVFKTKKPQFQPTLC